MKISRLIEQHRKFQTQGLAGNFGDGYLMAHNGVFRRIREAAVGQGYVFSTDRNEAYETFPLLQLENILKAKTFPYANNVAAFSQLTPAGLEALSWEDIDGNLKKNYLLHEACHGVVRTLASRILGPAVLGGDIEAQRKFVLRMLVEESCANTCELFAAVETGDATHRIFFEMNSYMDNFENCANLKKAMAEIGPETLIQFMFYAYLYANFLRESLEDKPFQVLMQMTSRTALDVKKQKTLRALAKTAFLLSDRFRMQTIRFYLLLAGIKTPPEQLFAFDILSGLRENGAFASFLAQYGALVAGPVK